MTADIALGILQTLRGIESVLHTIAFLLALGIATRFIGFLLGARLK